MFIFDGHLDESSVKLIRKTTLLHWTCLWLGKLHWTCSQRAISFIKCPRYKQYSSFSNFWTLMSIVSVFFFSREKINSFQPGFVWTELVVSGTQRITVIAMWWIRGRGEGMGTRPLPNLFPSSEDTPAHFLVTLDPSLITARNEVGARLCFYTCLWFCSQEGSAPLHAGIHTPLTRGRHPPGAGPTLSTVHAGRYCKISNFIHLLKLSICL